MTQREFAKLLSVSQATISMALNNDPGISVELRGRIQKMANALGYSPNVASQWLRRGKNNLIGVIIPDTKSSFYSDLLSELHHCAQEKGYLVLLEGFDENGDIKRAMKTMKQFHVSGILAECGVEAESFLDRNIPTVVLEWSNFSPQISPWVSIVYPDMYRSGCDMAEYLLRSGRKNFTFLGRISDEELRYRGFADVCQKTDGVQLQWLPGFDSTVESGYELAGEMLNHFPKTEVVLAHNDYMAIGVLRRLWEAGISVPEQIAVAGFDNITMGNYATPALTSIGPDLRKFAAVAINEMLAAIANPGHHKEIPVHCQLTIRESA